MISCPDCESPEFTPVRKVTREREGLLARIFSALLGRTLITQSGWIVCCARCVLQYVVSRQGVYRIRGTEPAAAAPPPKPGERERKPDAQALADADMEWQT